MSKLKIKENIKLIYDILLNSTSSLTLNDENGFICKEVKYNNNILNVTNENTVEIIDNECPVSFLFGLHIDEYEFYIYFPGQVHYTKFLKVKTNEEYFQQSLIYDYHDLNLDDIILINEIHKIIEGHFTKE